MNRPRNPASGACSRVRRCRDESAAAVPACRWRWKIRTATRTSGRTRERARAASRLNRRAGAGQAGRAKPGASFSCWARLSLSADWPQRRSRCATRSSATRVSASPAQQHPGHRPDRSEPRGDAARLRRRHRAQHLFCSSDERRRQLEQIPWIEHATVMRLLPDQIRVAVVERQPVAFTRHGQQIGLVDANGVLLTMPPATMAEHHYSFPVVTGIDPRRPGGLAQGAHGGLPAPDGGAGRGRPALLRADFRDRPHRSRRCARADAGAGRGHPGALRRGPFSGALPALQGAHRGVAAAVSASGRGGSALRPAGGAGDGLGQARPRSRTPDAAGASRRAAARKPSRRARRRPIATRQASAKPPKPTATAKLSSEEEQAPAQTKKRAERQDAAATEASRRKQASRSPQPHRQRPRRRRASERR